MQIVNKPHHVPKEILEHATDEACQPNSDSQPGLHRGITGAALNIS
jgi:hypothetical protein